MNKLGIGMGTLACALSMGVLTARDAQAQTGVVGEDSGRGSSLDEEDFRPWDHGEFTMGFIGGQRSFDQTNFSQVSGGEQLNLDQPLSSAPYDRVNALGLRYDVRLVVSYVRMTAGFDIPFANYATGDTTQFYDIGGQQRAVTSRSLDMKGLRFGIGAELPTGTPLTPFVDFMGTVGFIDTTLVVDGESYDLEATSFGFSVRGGARLQVRRWFFAQLSGEVGLGSDVIWGGELSVGFSTM